MKKSVVDYYYLTVTIVFSFFLLLSIIGKILFYRSLSDLIILIADLIIVLLIILCNCYYRQLRKQFRTIIALLLTFYSLLLLLLTAYYYIIPILGIWLSVLLFCLSYAQKTSKLSFSLFLIVFHIIVSFLQMLEIIPYYDHEIEKSIQADFITFLLINFLLSGAIIGTYLISENYRIERSVICRPGNLEKEK